MNKSTHIFRVVINYGILKKKVNSNSSIIQIKPNIDVGGRLKWILLKQVSIWPYSL